MITQQTLKNGLIWGLAVVLFTSLFLPALHVGAVDEGGFSGYVVDSNGDPVEGASVKYYYDDIFGTTWPTPPTNPNYLVVGVTDSAGYWQLDGPLPMGQYAFFAWRDDLGYTPLLPWALTAPEVLHNIGNLAFSVEGGGSTGTGNEDGLINGFVRDTNGIKQVGETVRIEKLDSLAGSVIGGPWDVTTDNDGKYTKDDLLLGYYYRVSMPHRTDESPAGAENFLDAAFPVYELDFIVPVEAPPTGGEDGSISGSVEYDNATSAVGKLVRIEKRSVSGAVLATWDVVTDGLGAYAIDDLPLNYEYRVFLPNWPDSSPLQYLLNLSTSVPSFAGRDFTLDDNTGVGSGEDGVVWGYVYDIDGDAVPGVSVKVHLDGFPTNGETVLTNASGKYIVDGLHWPNNYRIDLLPQNGIDAPDQFRFLGPNSTGDIVTSKRADLYAWGDLVLGEEEELLTGADGTLSGTIKLASGATATGVAVRVYAFNGFEDRETFVTTAGAYTLPLPPGVWFIGYEILTDGYAQVTLGDELTITPGQTRTHNITIRRNASTAIVTVKKSDGSLFPGAWVEVSRFSVTAETGEVTSDNSTLANEWFGKEVGGNGSATFLVPPGTWYIRAHAPYDPSRVNPSEAVVVIGDGQTKSLTLQFRTRNATLTGTVLNNATGAPVDAFVGAWSDSGGLAEGRANADGVYELKVLGGETWHVGALANIGGVLHTARPVDVPVASGSVTTQNLIVKRTDFSIPPPVIGTVGSSDVFEQKLANGTAFTCAAGGCFAAGENVEVTLTPDVTAPDQGGTGVIGLAYDVQAKGTQSQQNITQLAKQTRITIPYTDADATSRGVLERDLRIGYFDEAKGVWVELTGCAVDTSGNKVTCTTDHLTRFALLTPAYSSVVGPAINEGDLVRGPDGVSVWIVNGNGYKRHIFNPAVFNMYGHFIWNNIVEVSQSTLDSFTTSDLYRAVGDAQVFALEEINEVQGLANKRWLNFSAEEFANRGYVPEQIFEINPVERDFYQEGDPIL